MLRTIVRALILALLCATSGCGILIQTVMGWHERHVERRTVQHAVQISSEPTGAEVSRKNPGGSVQQLGSTPFTDQVTYDVDMTIETPRWAGLLIGGLIDTALSVGLIYAQADANESTVAGVELLVLAAIPEVVASAVWGLSGPSIKARKQIPDTQWYTYTGKTQGLPEASVSVHAPDQGRAELRLAQKLVVREEEDEPGQMKKAVIPEAGWVIAVMKVEDLNADHKEQAIDQAVIESLGDQIRTVIAQQGVRTIDRSEQDRALSAQVSVMQGDTIKACNDDSCQIELGRALSASHIVRAKVSRLNGQCVFSTELIDLKVEEATASTSAQGDCATQGLFNISEEAVKKLVARSQGPH